jgi:hypothetical protein
VSVFDELYQLRISFLRMNGKPPKSMYVGSACFDEMRAHPDAHRLLHFRRDGTGYFEVMGMKVYEVIRDHRHLKVTE